MKYTLIESKSPTEFPKKLYLQLYYDADKAGEGELVSIQDYGLIHELVLQNSNKKTGTYVGKEKRDYKLNVKLSDIDSSTRIDKDGGTSYFVYSSKEEAKKAAKKNLLELLEVFNNFVNFLKKQLTLIKK